MNLHRNTWGTLFHQGACSTQIALPSLLKIVPLVTKDNELVATLAQVACISAKTAAVQHSSQKWGSSGPWSSSSQVLTSHGPGSSVDSFPWLKPVNHPVNVGVEINLRYHNKNATYLCMHWYISITQCMQG